MQVITREPLIDITKDSDDAQFDSRSTGKMQISEYLPQQQ